MIRIRELKKSFGSNVVLDGVDIDIEKGIATVVMTNQFNETIYN